MRNMTMVVIINDLQCEISLKVRSTSVKILDQKEKEEKNVSLKKIHDSS